MNKGDTMGGPSKYFKLYQQLKNDISSGNVDYDEPLPSLRETSLALGLSRTTVERAYSQLLLEGYVYSVQGVGYFANMLSEEMKISYEPVEDLEHINEDAQPKKVYDFCSEYADSEALDIRLWKRHINYVLNHQANRILEPLESQGAKELRLRISNYIQMARDIKVSPSQIIIGAGVSNLLSQLTIVIKEQVTGLAIEDPGFPLVRDVFRQEGLMVTPIPLTEEGVDIGHVSHFKRQICYVSPAHQFPTGNVMQIGNRQALVHWANETDSYILEDDYNASLRYELFPISSLKSMDYHDRVIYLGSFSTYLIPGIRISYMILPSKLDQLYKAKKFPQSASLVDQLAFSRMIESGDYQRHINRMKKYYKKKTEYIHELLDKHLGYCDIKKNKSGLNVLVGLKYLKSGIREQDILFACNEKGVRIRFLNELIEQYKTSPTIVLNYRGISTKDMEKGIAIISEVLQGFTCS